MRFNPKETLDDLLHHSAYQLVLIHNSETSPYLHERLHFVSGDPSKHETLMNANILEAKSVVIFSRDDITDPGLADGQTLLVASSVESLSDRNGKNIYTVAEIMKQRNIDNFRHARVDEFVASHQTAAHIIARAAEIKGASEIFRQLASSKYGDEIYEIDPKPEWLTYKDANYALFELGATLISIGAARKGNQEIPKGTKLLIVCDSDAYKKIVC